MRRLRFELSSLRLEGARAVLLRQRCEVQSKPTPSGAHSLAARPGTLAGSLSIEARKGIEPFC